MISNFSYDGELPGRGHDDVLPYFQFLGFDS